MRNLAVFLDGTWNNKDHNTNVWRLKVLVASRTPDGVGQIAWYHEGVGVKWYDRLSGGAMGEGLAKNVRLAYAWLVETHEEGDEIYIFGFSRGAFTARTLGGMIARAGLLYPGAAMTINDIYKIYQTRKGPDAMRGIWEIDWDRKAGKVLSDHEQLLLESSRRIPIRFIGVWDTVGRLGIPVGAIRGLSKKHQFHNTNPSRIYRFMYQAMAVDEHRKLYAPTLWTEFTPDDESQKFEDNDHTIEQRWFIGAHSDVGGGRRGGRLGQIPLAWLQAHAGASGLAFKRTIDLQGDEQLAGVQDSFGDFMFGAYRVFRLGRRFFREIGRDPEETKTRKGRSHVLNETVDITVVRRWRSDPSYRPKNLEEWSRKRNIDLNNIDVTGSDAIVAGPSTRLIDAE